MKLLSVAVQDITDTAALVQFIQQEVGALDIVCVHGITKSASDALLPNGAPTNMFGIVSNALGQQFSSIFSRTDRVSGPHGVSYESGVAVFSREYVHAVSGLNEEPSPEAPALGCLHFEAHDGPLVVAGFDSDATGKRLHTHVVKTRAFLDLITHAVVLVASFRAGVDDDSRQTLQGGWRDVLAEPKTSLFVSPGVEVSNIAYGSLGSITVEILKADD